MPGLLPLLLLLSACGSSDEASFVYQSSLGDIRTNGVVLLPGGETAVAGMFGSTCTIDTTFGLIGSDYDFPGDDERVEDAGTVMGVAPNGEVLLRTSVTTFEDEIATVTLDADRRGRNHSPTRNRRWDTVLRLLQEGVAGRAL